MKKWYDEEYEFQVEVTGFLRGDHTERYCPKAMLLLFPLMEAVRSGGDLENVGGSGPYCKDIVCPDGCVLFRLTAKKLANENFFKGDFLD